MRESLEPHEPGTVDLTGHPDAGEAFVNPAVTRRQRVIAIARIAITVLFMKMPRNRCISIEKL